MSLPDLNDDGELPIGVHRAALTELLTRFGGGTAQRNRVGAQLRRIHQLAYSTGFLDRLVVFGSFVTDKAEPRDVDVILVMRDNFDLEQCPTEAAALFDHARADREFAASVFWIRPSMLIFESLEDFVSGWQRKRGGGRRGIVEVFG